MGTTTLSDMRDRVRIRLEDTSPNPLFAIEEIDEALGHALADYTMTELEQKTDQLTVDQSGQTMLGLPDDLRQVVRLISPTGQIMPMRGASPMRRTANEDLAWEQFSGAFHFSRPIPEGDYTLWYLAVRSMPTDGGDFFPVDHPDDVLIITGAASWCVERRSLEEWKRGPLPARYETVARRLKGEYAQLWHSKRKRMRTGTMQVTA